MTDGVGDTVRSYLNTINCLFARDQIVDPAMDYLEYYYSWVYYERGRRMQSISFNWYITLMEERTTYNRILPPQVGKCFEFVCGSCGR